MIRLSLLFIVVPIVELALLLEVGERLGTWPTVAIVLGTGVLGAALLRSAGFSVLRSLVDEARHGLPSGTSLAEAALVVVGAVLLITPGVLSDLVGLLLMVRPVRRALAPWVVRQVMARIVVVRPAPPRAHPFASPFDGPTDRR